MSIFAVLCVMSPGIIFVSLMAYMIIRGVEDEIWCRNKLREWENDRK